MRKRHKGIGSARNRLIARGEIMPNNQPNIRKDSVKRSTMRGKLPHELPKAYQKNDTTPHLDGINESTNWKGSKSVSLSRYAAKQGFGVQLTQTKAMPGERIPISGIHIKMPLKEIPQLIKGLQNVYKAKTNVQLGDDD